MRVSVDKCIRSSLSDSEARNIRRTPPTLRHFAKTLGLGHRGAYEPSLALVDAAARDIPVVFSDSDHFSPATLQLPVPPGEIASLATALIRCLRRRGHDENVGAWGIYRLVERGLLGAEVIELMVPEEPL